MRRLFYKTISHLGSLWLALTDSKVRVLAYHDVPNADAFEKQLTYLKTNYNIISYQQFYDFLFKNTSLPKKALLITFDDGDFSFYQNGYPLLKKLSIPAILFVITELIDTEKPFWWNEIEYHLGKEKGNAKVWELKNVKDKERLDFLNNMRSNSSKKPFSQRQLRTVELMNLQKDGITVSNHSHSHPMFNQCDENELTIEMNLSIKFLKNDGLDATAFAYPNGNYSDFAENVLAQNNVKTAFLFDHKINAKNINPLRVSRIRVNTNAALDEFKSKVTGLHSFIYNLKK